MEKLSKYEQKTAEVKKLPQETSEQQAEKKDRAQLLRMELLIDNALCTELFISTFEENPDLSVDALKKVLKNMLSVKEINVDIFVDNVVATRENLANVYENDILPYAKSIGPYSDSMKTVGYTLFQWSLPKDRNFIAPIGWIGVDVGHPFAFIIYVSDPRDFEIIDDRSNVGGFYTRREHTYTETQTIFGYPLIVINGLPIGQDHVLTDEIGHAEHRVFKNTLDEIRQEEIKTPGEPLLREQILKAPHKLVWGHFGMYPDAVARVLDDEQNIKRTKLEMPSQDRTEADAQKLRALKKEQARKQILGFAYEQAKDELLAEFNVTKSLTYIANVLKKDGLYDYFKKMDIPIDSKIYDDLWDEYNKVVLDAFHTTVKALQAYENFGLEKRTNVFRWVLGQIPLEDWKKQLEGGLFIEEAEILSKINEVIINHPDFRADSKQSDFMKLVDRFNSDVYKNQERLILPMLREYLVEFEKMKP